MSDSQIGFKIYRRKVILSLSALSVGRTLRSTVHNFGNSIRVARNELFVAPIAIGSKPGIDATRSPPEGNNHPWPPLIKMDEAMG